MTFLTKCTVTRPDRASDNVCLPAYATVLRSLILLNNVCCDIMNQERPYLISDYHGLLSVEYFSNLDSAKYYLNPSEYVFHEDLERASLIERSDIKGYSQIPHLCLSTISITKCSAILSNSMAHSGTLLIGLQMAQATLDVQYTNQLCIQMDTQSLLVIRGNPSCIVVEYDRFHLMVGLGRIKIKPPPDQVFQRTLLVFESDRSDSLFRARTSFILPTGCKISPTNRPNYFIIHREVDLLSDNFVVQPELFGVPDLDEENTPLLSTVLKDETLKRLNSYESMMQ